MNVAGAAPASAPVALVTGASSGIGLVTARALAERGWRVVCVSRGSGSGAASVEEIVRETGNADVHHIAADLSRPGEIRRMVRAFGERFARLDVLVANAGAFGFRRGETEDGLERTFALNHLGAFLPSVLLLPHLSASPSGRVIVVSSNASHYARLQLDDPESTKGYDGMRAYSWSKLANLLFTFEFARRLQGTGVRVNAVHPGFVATRFAHDAGGATAWSVRLAQRLFGRSPERGADTIIWLATSAEVADVSGGYFIDRRLRAPPRLAQDEHAQRRLWEISEEMTGIASEEWDLVLRLAAEGAAIQGDASGARHTTQRS